MGYPPTTERLAAGWQSAWTVLTGTTRRKAAMVAIALGLVLAGLTTLAVPSAEAFSVKMTILRGIGWICMAIVKFLGQMMLMVVGVLINVAQYNNFVNEAAVANGWVIVRDVCNMFFIGVLLLMALGTILGGVTKFTVKGGNLTKLLLIAIVINFSRTICGLIIDLSQVIMLTFVSGFKEAAGGNFVQALGINEILQDNPNFEGESVNFLEVVASYLLAVVMTAIALFTVVVIAVSLIVRIIYLWLLIILSPLAFFARAVPAGFAAGLYSKWWGMFIERLTAGPLMAFFLWLSLISVQAGDFDTSFKTGSTGEEIGGVTAAFQSASLQKFIIAVCLLLVGMQMAKEIAGSSTSAGFKVAGAAKRMAGKAGRATGRLAYKATGAQKAVEKGKEAALKVGTRIPLVKNAAAAKLTQHRGQLAARDKKAAASMEGLTAKERERFTGGLAITREAKARKKAAMQANYSEFAKKGPAKGQSQEAYTADMVQRRKQLKKMADDTGDDSLKAEIKKTDKAHPSFIIDHDEKDPEQRKEQQALHKKTVSRMKASQIEDMDDGEVDERFAMNGNARQMILAAKNGVGPAAEALKGQLQGAFGEGQLDNLDVKNNSQMKEMEAAVKREQTKMMLKQNNFDSLDNDQQDGLINAQGADIAGMAMTGSASVVEALVRNGKGSEAAKAMDPELIKRLPKEIGNQLRGVLINAGENDKALAAGADLKDVLKTLSSNMNFTDDQERHSFQQSIQTQGGFDKAVGNISGGDLEKNGGVNDVTISVVSQLNADRLGDMAKNDGTRDQAAALLPAINNIKSMTEEAIAKAANEVRQEVMSKTGDENQADQSSKGFEIQLRQAQQQAKQISDKMAASNSTLKADLQNMSFMHRSNMKGKAKVVGAVAGGVALTAAAPAIAITLASAYGLKKAMENAEGMFGALGKGWDKTKEGAKEGWGATKRGAKSAFQATKEGSVAAGRKARRTFKKI